MQHIADSSSLGHSKYVRKAHPSQIYGAIYNVGNAQLFPEATPSYFQSILEQVPFNFERPKKLGWDAALNGEGSSSRLISGCGRPRTVDALVLGKKGGL